MKFFFLRGDVAQVIPAELLFAVGLCAARRGDSAMARTYREIAVEEMLGTVEKKQ